MKIRILIMAAFALVFQTAQAATVTTDPLNSTEGLNSIFTIDVVGEGFPITEGGGFNLAYDPSILNVNSVSIDGAFWTFVNVLGTIDNVLGTLSEVQVSDFSFPGISGDFIVATIEFHAVGLGTSNLTLTNSVGNPWAYDGSPITPLSFVSGSVTVVPIPAAVWLFGSGLLGLVGVARRKKTA